MPTKRSSATRKKRTRDHIIADLSANHVEGHILRCGYTAERVVHDYGVDLFMTTYSADGELENDIVLFQLKATDRLKRTSDGTAAVVRADQRDLEWWLAETFPVILVLYDAQADRGYWLYVQEQFEKEKKSLARDRKSINVPIPVENVLSEVSIRKFAAAKAAVQAQLKGVKHYE